MNTNPAANYPNLTQRLYSVWFRHFRVYTRYFLSNGLPPFLDPLFFLMGVGLGLGSYITQSMEGLGYIQFLGMGLLMTSAMFTASFECTWGTFIRMEFEKVYDGMLAAPITAENLIVGEMLWAGTKGFFFSFAVLSVLSLCQVLSFSQCLLAPVFGFLTGLMFATLGLLVTSYIKTINHFSFYFTGIISPMFFFCGVVFPISSLPEYLRPIVEALPLTHTVRLVRTSCSSTYSSMAMWDLLYIFAFITIIGAIATKRLKKRLIS